MEQIQIDITDLKEAYNNLIQALNNLKDVEGIDEEYKQLDIITEAIDNKRISLEAELENLEEEAYLQENEEQWKAEQQEQYNQYWKSQFYNK